MAFSSGNTIVDEVRKIPFTGNILCNTWFNTIKLENGKPDTVAIILLSEIVYWYRPSEVKDEKTGMFLGYKKKFKADLLQRSYESFSNQFGFTKRQVKDACKRLEDMNVIKRHFRTITYNKKLANNVLYIELNVEKLKEITVISIPYDDKTSEGYDVKTSEGVTVERQTNTKSTITKNTINNIESVSPPLSSTLNEKKSKRKIERIAFAHNVFLTKKKYEELCKLFGKPNVDKKIIAFSKYQDDTSKKTYDQAYHFRTLKNWLERDGKPNEQSGKTRQELEREELERLLG